MFSHIYVEREIINHPKTQKILAHFQNSSIIIIEKYTHIFSRKHQNFSFQKDIKNQNLILAKQYQNFIYEGAKVCQSFDNEYFYYTSCVKNCIYDCEYCYLRGMYPSGNIVMFVNLEDTFRCVEDVLKYHDMYICISYDTDLMALEDITGFVKDWTDFAKQHKTLKIEIRTKCARIDLYDSFSSAENIIYAVTLSPYQIWEKYEKRTASPQERIKCINYMLKKGYNVRVCFDPVLYMRDWKKAYDSLFDLFIKKTDTSRILDFSVGSFRISGNYLKNMRRFYPSSVVAHFPYEKRSGYYTYPDRIKDEMESYIIEKLNCKINSNKIYYLEKALS